MTAPVAHVPPQNIEAEESVLGAMLVAEPTLTRVIDEVKLSAEDFYLEKHATIYRCVHDLYAASKPVDELSVGEALVQRNEIEAAGGKHYVSELAAKVPAAGNAKHYAEIVQQNSLLRRLLGAGQEIRDWVYQSNGTAPHKLLRRAEDLLREIGMGASSEGARIVTASEFANVEEAGADPLLGSPGDVVIPEGADVMLYGDGGASKTTLAIDLAFHLASGDPWLGIDVPRPARVLLIEAEGPRPMFRDKVARKLGAWDGSGIDDRLLVLERPWAQFRFSEAHDVADLIGGRDVDVVLAGPLTRVGMEELGTLQHVRDFIAEVDWFRRRSGRTLTVGLIHHENKGGSVSGAWEGAVDTLLHAQVRDAGKTTLTFQKVRWASSWHKQQLDLSWSAGEGFEVVDVADRLYVAEIAELLGEKGWLTVREISQPIHEGGIGAGRRQVEDSLRDNYPTRFEKRTGVDAKALGRHSNATLWGLAQEQKPDEPDRGSHRVPEERLGLAPPLKGPDTSDETPLPADSLVPGAMPDVAKHRSAQ